MAIELYLSENRITRSERNNQRHYHHNNNNNSQSRVLIDYPGTLGDGEVQCPMNRNKYNRHLNISEQHGINAKQARCVEVNSPNVYKVITHTEKAFKERSSSWLSSFYTWVLNEIGGEALVAAIRFLALCCRDIDSHYVRLRYHSLDALQKYHRSSEYRSTKHYLS